MQRVILNALAQCQKGRNELITLEQYQTILDNTGRQFKVKGYSEANILNVGITARILASSGQASSHDELLANSFILSDSSTDLESQKLAILKGESHDWQICRVNLSTLGIDLVVIRRDRGIFQEPRWKKRHLRYIHFGHEAQEQLLLTVKGDYCLYQRQLITCFSNGQDAKMIQGEMLMFSEHQKRWRLCTHYRCDDEYAKSSNQVWTKTVYDKPLKEK